MSRFPLRQNAKTALTFRPEAVRTPLTTSMTLLDALELVKQPIPEPTSRQEIYLQCGFTPLHLKTFLAAQMRLRFPNDCIRIKTGLYGDLAGNIERIPISNREMVCVVVEWPDLDPRLGIRAFGGWRLTDIPDIVKSARRQTERLTSRIQTLAEHAPVCVSITTLPLPPIFPTRGSQAHQHECKLREIVASFATTLSACSRVRLVNSQRLDELSPFARRFDAREEIRTGFPFRLEHAALLAELFGELIQDVPPKKGLITDLDDTLWAGIVGETGCQSIAWNIGTRSHTHGLYQLFLNSLSSAGVLLAVASKNNLAVVQQALTRPDIVLSAENLFPIEAHWGPKSESIQRILDTWNVGPSDVIFVDDSPIEVAEVRAVFPLMECHVFPKGNDQAVWDLLRRLRDCFAKRFASPEDQIRLKTIRNTLAARGALRKSGLGPDDFLREAKGAITFSLGNDTTDQRAFELTNKTNQFNLNGMRFTETEWLRFLQSYGSFLLTASYRDKYGSLGKIAVVTGTTNGRTVRVNSWVMSCRAFSRRIEHQCLAYLFDKWGADKIIFDYVETTRNGPLQEFFTEVLGQRPVQGFAIHKSNFMKGRPLFHRIEEAAIARS